MYKAGRRSVHGEWQRVIATMALLALVSCTGGETSSSRGTPNPPANSPSNLTPAPPDITVPNISNVTVSSVTETSATVTWTTDESSTSVVNYGLTNSYSATANGDSNVTGHGIHLAGLNANTTYHYNVVSADAASNTATSADATFTTLSLPSPPPTDTTPPEVVLTAPTVGANVSGVVIVSANASDNVGVVGVQFQLDSQNLGAEDTSAPYSVGWNAATASIGAHTLTAVARDQEGLARTSISVTVTVVTVPPAPSAACESGYSTEKFNLTAPYCLDQRDDDYLRYPDGNPVAIANGDAAVTDDATGSYTGGHAAKIVPPTNEGYAGLGNFNFTSGAVGNRMNIRYLVYWGYDAVQSGVKLNIVNDGVSTRPMVISREMRSGMNTMFAHDYMIPIPSQNVNEAPTIRDPGYPDSPSFFIAGSSAPLSAGNYAHQWVCWEFEIITGGDAPILNFYIHTRDGRIAFGPGHPYATHTWTEGAVDLVRASVGWYWGPGWMQTAEAYVKVSDVVISNSYIGPPPDFAQ